MTEPNAPYTKPPWLKGGEYRILHGRTYHSDRTTQGESWEPNDHRHNEASDIIHRTLKFVLDDRLFLAPLSKDIERVLDIGAGTGTWARDFARGFPETQVIATDITPIVSVNSVANANVACLIEDAAATWSQPDSSVDYVHIRYLVGSIPDWDALFREAFRVLKPGGYVESLEPSSLFQSDDGSVKEGSALDRWGKVFNEGGRKIGRSFNLIGDDVQRMGMIHAGFDEPVVDDFKVPISPWPEDKKSREAGRCYQMTMDQDAEGYVLYMFSSVMGWTVDQVERYIEDLLGEVHNDKIYGYFDLRNVYARKPDAEARRGSPTWMRESVCQADGMGRDRPR